MCKLQWYSVQIEPVFARIVHVSVQLVYEVCSVVWLVSVETDSKYIVHWY